MPLHIQEKWIDATRDLYLGESEVYESYFDTPGEAFRALQREYGRCVSKVYVDTPDGKVQAIGWTFVKRERYCDSPKTFLRETWVTLHEKPDTVVRTPHYHPIGG